jgi:hypothetical protein
MSFFKSLLPVAGTAIGTYFGGPIGGAIGGSIGAGIAGKPKAGPNPANSAMPYLNQIPGVGQQYYNPYIQQGQRQGNMLEDQFSRMSQDPTAFLNALTQGYKPSEGYGFKRDLLSKELGNTAAAGGYSGTENHQLQQGELINGLLNTDMQQYLNNILGIQGAGQQGAQQQALQGFQASGNLADYLGNNLNQQASLGYHGQAQQNSNRLSGNNALMNFLGRAGGSLLGAAGEGGAFGPGGRFEKSWG